MYAAVGCHPNVAQQLDEALLAELAAHPRCVAIGETGLDYYRDRAPREHQLRAFEAQIELARELDKPLVIHTRAADDDTLACCAPARGGLRVIMHCFSMPERVEECLEAGWWISFAGNVTYPKATALAAAAALVPAERLLVETDAPYLAPQSRAWQAQRAGRRGRDRAFVAAARGVEPLDAGGDARAQRRRAVRLVSTLTQPSLRRLAQFERAARAATSGRTSSSTRTSSA